jgi:hypothetical protein
VTEVQNLMFTFCACAAAGPFGGVGDTVRGGPGLCTQTGFLPTTSPLRPRAAQSVGESNTWKGHWRKRFCARCRQPEDSANKEAPGLSRSLHCNNCGHTASRQSSDRSSRFTDAASFRDPTDRSSTRFIVPSAKRDAVETCYDSLFQRSALDPRRILASYFEEQDY